MEDENYMNRRYKWLKVGEAPTIYDDLEQMQYIPRRQAQGQPLMLKMASPRRASDGDEDDNEEEDFGIYTNLYDNGVTGRSPLMTEIYESRYEGTDRHEIVLVDKIVGARHKSIDPSVARRASTNAATTKPRSLSSTIQQSPPFLSQPKMIQNKASNYIILDFELSTFLLFVIYLKATFKESPLDINNEPLRNGTPQQNNVSFIKETKTLLNNRKQLNQDTILPILDAFLAKLDEPSTSPKSLPQNKTPPNSYESPAALGPSQPVNLNSKEAIDAFIYETLMKTVLFI